MHDDDKFMSVLVGGMCLFITILFLIGCYLDYKKT